MSWLVQSRLVNSPFADPGLLLSFLFRPRVILFDLGDLSAVAPRELLRVTDAFVSHRHMDHFAGFDRLLRLRLNRADTIRLVGPPGMTAGVRAKLDSYTWNLLDETSTDFAVLVADYDGDHLGPWTAFRARDAFRPTEAGPAGLPPGLVLQEDDLRIEATTLDHGLPCLAFALQEHVGVNVWTEGLFELGLTPGPWLQAAKTAVRRHDPDDTPIEAGGRAIPLGALRERAFRIAPGQRLAYVTDAAFTPGNADRIVALAKDAHHLYIEAAFLHEDEALATARKHLTARQAGTLAREAGARRLTTFHHSPRYLERREDLAREAETAFGG
ncbi:Metal-dependent hydrolase of the beta-lactamase superfamily III [Rubellimicrobium mesophilum DSM 19309]|uniref:Metal-dependent hydrolase of the beta-lactamase superfamily III n=1 Tax=Rubellimicrobium mesophilum DSM 19309 TaxID=442562 RepID=A0A017HLN4_9RHOB|nr:MBL fold metallo-hydrolase [Rubellimicrobium mesophilum]EYD75276.1 Metal-dependent hydrolase of the beta-lactamase superfamily III [Rubellimicrobium mesophilum DSM 19309]